MARGGELGHLGGGGDGLHGRMALASSSSVVVVCEDELRDHVGDEAVHGSTRRRRLEKEEEGEETQHLQEEEETQPPAAAGAGGASGSARHHESTVTLRVAHPHRPHSVRWTDETIDNEHMGKKKSKKCCIYHKPRQFGDWSDTDSEGEHYHCHHCHDHA